MCICHSAAPVLTRVGGVINVNTGAVTGPETLVHLLNRVSLAHNRVDVGVPSSIRMGAGWQALLDFINALNGAPHAGVCPACRGQPAATLVVATWVSKKCGLARIKNKSVKISQ